MRGVVRVSILGKFVDGDGRRGKFRFRILWSLVVGLWLWWEGGRVISGRGLVLRTRSGFFRSLGRVFRDFSFES